MMERITKYKILVLLWLLCVMVACSSDDGPIERLRPLLNETTIELEEGDSTILEVINAQNISHIEISDSTVIGAKIKGVNIVVVGLCKGSAILTVVVDDIRLNCDVKVIARESPQYDFSQELEDDRARFVSQSLSMYYDTPGIMFSISNDNVVGVRNLSTGDVVEFYLNCSTLSQGNLPNAKLVVNGDEVTLQRATLELLSSDGSMWCHLVDENGGHIALVVTDL